MVKGAKAAATARLVEAFMFKLEGIKVEKEKDCEMLESRWEIDLAIKRLSK